MNVVIEILGAVLSRVGGVLALSLLVWVLRVAGKGLGTTAHSLLALAGARRLDTPSAAAADLPAGTPTVTCPHCGATTAQGPFCSVCGRALPEA
jgi:hypothetical protein